MLFQQPRPTKIKFHINITADSISGSSCSVSGPYERPAFCRVHEKASRYGNISTAYDQWKLCSNSLSLTWITQANVDGFIEVLANTVVPWCAHGPSVLVATGLISDALITNAYVYIGEHNDFDVVELHLKDLDCQPYAHQLINAVGQFFTWVRISTASEYSSRIWYSMTCCMLHCNNISQSKM